VVALILVSFLNAPAEAARVGPQPLILLFQDGYGIIAAEVLQASPVKVEGQHRYPYKYRVSFIVRQVVAEPVKGQAFPLSPNDTLVVEITVGYACMIEDWRGQVGRGGGKKAIRKGGPLAPGRKYYLTVKCDPAKKTYTHASGASILQPVEDFAAQRMSDIRATRALAALDLGPRIQRCQELLLHPKTPQFVRLQALAETRHRLERVETASHAQRRAIIACYWKLWKGDTSHLDLTFLSALDFTMRVGLRDAFARSEERAKLWTARMFAPLNAKTPAERQAECIQRNNLIAHFIVEAGMAHPEDIGARLIREMNDPAWPADLHVVLVRCLLMLYRTVNAPPKTWEPFLQDYLPRLIDRSRSWPLRLIAANLEWAIREPQHQERRAFRPGADVLRALQRARDRVHKLSASKAPRDPDAASARASLDRLLKSLK